MTSLRSLMGIGPMMEKKLNDVGIFSAEELKEIGSKEVYIMIKSRDPKVCAPHLYTLEGAITDTKWNLLPTEVQEDLKKFSKEVVF